MITPLYIAVESFNPEWGESWLKYIEGSGLKQLTELISLDCCLCPCAIDKLEDEDWNHNVHEDFMTEFFVDLDYLIKRTEKLTLINILAAVQNPLVESTSVFKDQRFTFKGYDLVEKGKGISALTNCGGYPLAFKNTELSNIGLVTKFVRAQEIQASLLRYYQDDHHANCEIWALWRLEP